MDYNDPVTLDGPVAGPAGSHAHASSGVITVGRKKYAVNLYWQPSPSGRVSQAAREAASQPGQMADFYAARPGNARGRVPQFGLGQKEYGHKVGQPTGAASLAEDQPGSWAGVFRVPEGWWLVVLRDDLIAPDGDTLFSNEQEARARLFEEINLGGLQRIYAPSHWNIGGSDIVEVALLMQGRSDFRLQFVHYPVKAILLGIIGLIAIAALGYFAVNWQQDREKAFEKGIGGLSSEQQAIARLQQQQQLAPPPPPPPPPKRSWEDKPTPVDFLEACRQALEQVPATTLGWAYSDVTCGSGGLVVGWRRLSGPALVPPNASVTALDNQAVSNYEIHLPAARGPEQLLPSGDLVHKTMLGNWKMTIEALPDDLPPAAPTPTVPGAPPPPPPLPAPWIKKKITLTSETAPWNVWSRYADLPGLVLNSVIWKGDSWSTEGTFYENR